ncbi:hypothetical protein MEBOL_001087 [Melittangium boletus DSM 14713]|uniref:Uncharacterized protein n=1 Tax=Melittangium boletus DSM 14713 TaxID=1294270 RepID=A0A250I8V2_9BACT|nr:hypothetical protein MEBOL_001087 [Melittangium boletus DSM 14713]
MRLVDRAHVLGDVQVASTHLIRPDPAALPLRVVAHVLSPSSRPEPLDSRCAALRHRGAHGARRAVLHGDPPALSKACRAALHGRPPTDTRPSEDTAVALEALHEAPSASGSFGEHPGAPLVSCAPRTRTGAGPTGSESSRIPTPPRWRSWPCLARTPRGARRRQGAATWSGYGARPPRARGPPGARWRQEGATADVRATALHHRLPHAGGRIKTKTPARLMAPGVGNSARSTRPPSLLCVAEGPRHAVTGATVRSSGSRG